MEHNPCLHAAVMNVAENQIRNQDPPETKQAYDRLRAEGMSDKEARRLIACVVASEIFEVLKRKEPFDPVSSTKALSELPKLPWDE